MANWRDKVLLRLDITLILFELILSVIFLIVAYLTSDAYLRGIGVGLAITWVTSAIAYMYKRNSNLNY